MIPAEFALLADPGAALKARCQLIRQARHRILAQYYSWEEDGSGKLLLAELVRAARRGVVVQLLIDDLYGGENRFLEAVAAEPGIEVRLFNPFWLRGWRPLTLLLEGVLSFRRINHRMHNKPLLVDGSQASTFSPLLLLIIISRPHDHFRQGGVGRHGLAEGIHRPGCKSPCQG